MKHPEIHYVLGYKLGQDHIETLVSKIRSQGRFNNNPDVVQFVAALKSLLVKTEITPSCNANCLEMCDTNGGILVRPKKPPRNSENSHDGEEEHLISSADTAQITELDI